MKDDMISKFYTKASVLKYTIACKILAFGCKTLKVLDY